jgi:hypothetical protein
MQNVQSLGKCLTLVTVFRILLASASELLPEVNIENISLQEREICSALRFSSERFAFVSLDEASAILLTTNPFGR